jgi:4-amino-4-deoxy-L-arabinose transferase-like glycosyltransferase
MAIETKDLKNKLKITQSPSFYFFVTGIFLIIISPNLLSEGMFMDGLIYSTLAKNLSNGIGTFWNPHFTTTCMAEFHEHPPLAFGIQSIFFSFFGESRFIEKFYSLLTFVMTGYIILRIWKVLRYNHGWVPLLFWLSFPVVSWACCNNMLENTLMVFTSLSILFYLKSLNNNKYFFIFLSGFMLALGFLTKGFVAFFPWSFPFLFWMLLRQKSFRNMIVDSLGVFVFSVAPLLLLVIIFPDAKFSLQKYIDTQVINSLKNVSSVDSRFFIIIRLISELIIPIGLCVLFLIWGWLRKVSLKFIKSNYRSALVFILLGLTGVLPIMISMKQSGFYILATFPFFAIGIGILINPLIDLLFKKINNQSKGLLVFRWIGYGFFFTGIIFCFYFSNYFGRDSNKIKDTYQILSILPSGSIINIYPNMWQDWSLHGYFGRYKNVSLDPNLENKREYLLIQNEYYSDTTERYYKIINLPTTDYKLLQRI